MTEKQNHLSLLDWNCWASMGAFMCKLNRVINELDLGYELALIQKLPLPKKYHSQFEKLIFSKKMILRGCCDKLSQKAWCIQKKNGSSSYLKITCKTYLNVSKTQKTQYFRDISLTWKCPKKPHVGDPIPILWPNLIFTWITPIIAFSFERNFLGELQIQRLLAIPMRSSAVCWRVNAIPQKHKNIPGSWQG